MYLVVNDPSLEGAFLEEPVQQIPSGHLWTSDAMVTHNHPGPSRNCFDHCWHGFLQDKQLYFVKHVMEDNHVVGEDVAESWIIVAGVGPEQQIQICDTEEKPDQDIPPEKRENYEPVVPDNEYRISKYRGFQMDKTPDPFENGDAPEEDDDDPDVNDPDEAGDFEDGEEQEE